jgi:hypothetical protein
MCGIAGISFSPGSTVNRHRLATALLRASETRGRDASGYAWVSPNGDGVYKKDLPGSQLHTGRIPSDATGIILHTRNWTHGSPKVNENNHPVISPSGDIRLVHNGVIYNHDEIRYLLGKQIAKGLAEVDSAVIPAIIEEYGLEATEHLEGDAACAWFDRETGDTIHLAKFSHSPVAFTTLLDGTFVFASTPSILAEALQKVGLQWVGAYPSPFESMHESDYFQVMDGTVISESEVQWKQTTYNQYGWRGVTDGYVTRGSEAEPMALQSTVHAPDQQQDPKVFFGTEIVTDDEIEEMRLSYEEDMAKRDPDYPLTTYQPMFFTVSHDGDYHDYNTLAGLLESLSWHSKLSVGEDALVGPDEGYLRWVNHFADIGHMNEDGSDELSWVKSEDYMSTFELLTPSWVRDGVDKLRLLVGA